jgi:hypothetical protein
MAGTHRSLAAIQVDSVPKSEFIAFFSSCQQAINSTLTKAAGTEEDEGLGAAQIKQVIRCALQVVRLTKRVMPNEEIGAVWRPEAMSSLLARFEQNVRFKNSSGVTGLCKQLLSAISSTPNVDKTAKSERAVSEVPSRLVANGLAKEKKVKSEKRRVDGLEGEGSPWTRKKRKKASVDAIVLS